MISLEIYLGRARAGLLKHAQNEKSGASKDNKSSKLAIKPRASGADLAINNLSSISLCNSYFSTAQISEYFPKSSSGKSSFAPKPSLPIKEQVDDQEEVNSSPLLNLQVRPYPGLQTKNSTFSPLYQAQSKAVENKQESIDKTNEMINKSKSLFSPEIAFERSQSEINFARDVSEPELHFLERQEPDVPVNRRLFSSRTVYASTSAGRSELNTSLEFTRSNSIRSIAPLARSESPQRQSNPIISEIYSQLRSRVSSIKYYYRRLAGTADQTVYREYQNYSHDIQELSRYTDKIAAYLLDNLSKLLKLEKNQISVRSDAYYTEGRNPVAALNKAIQVLRQELPDDENLPGLTNSCLELAQISDELTELAGLKSWLALKYTKENNDFIQRWSKVFIANGRRSQYKDMTKGVFVQSEYEPNEPVVTTSSSYPAKPRVSWDALTTEFEPKPFPPKKVANPEPNKPIIVNERPFLRGQSIDAGASNLNDPSTSENQMANLITNIVEQCAKSEKMRKEGRIIW